MIVTEPNDPDAPDALDELFKQSSGELDFDPYMPKCCLCGEYHYGGCG